MTKAMSPPTQRGNGWQVSFYHQGVRIRKLLQSEAAALSWQGWAKARLDQGLSIDDVKTASSTKDMTLKRLQQACMARYWKGTKNEACAETNSLEVTSIIGPEKLVHTLQTQDVDDLIDEMKERGYVGSTINRKLAAFSKMMKHAHERGWIASKPIVHRLPESEGRIRWYTVEEEAKILADLQVHNPSMWELVVFLLDTGCRLGEAMSVTWGDVDLEQGFVRFNGRKNGKAMGVPLAVRLLTTLKVKPDREGTTRVFSQWNSASVQHAWKMMRKRVGMKENVDLIHCLRHTFASRLVQVGTPILQVQQLLGHKTLAMTLRYAHLAPTNLREAIAKKDLVTDVSNQSDSFTLPTDTKQTDTHVSTVSKLGETKAG